MQSQDRALHYSASRGKIILPIITYRLASSYIYQIMYHSV